ncbi:hypothetical protein BH09SUM1_BH09SUM1_25570 [soil metagenome]
MSFSDPFLTPATITPTEIRIGGFRPLRGAIIVVILFFAVWAIDFFDRDAQFLPPAFIHLFHHPVILSSILGAVFLLACFYTEIVFDAERKTVTRTRGFYSFPLTSVERSFAAIRHIDLVAHDRDIDRSWAESVFRRSDNDWQSREERVELRVVMQDGDWWVCDTSRSEGRLADLGTAIARMTGKRLT